MKTAKDVVERALSDLESMMGCGDEVKYAEVVQRGLTRLLMKLDALDDRNEHVEKILLELSKLKQPFKLGDLWHALHDKDLEEWSGHYASISNSLKVLCDTGRVMKVSRGIYRKLG